MPDRVPDILICSCEDTMPLEVSAIEKGCRGKAMMTARTLCRAELDKLRAATAGTDPLIIGCTQEAPLFSEIAGSGAREINYVNIRETAGWSKDANSAGPKMAALIAAAAEPVPEISFVELNSEGVVLIYGCDEQAIEAGNLLKDHLDVTVLVRPPAEVMPPGVTDFPVVKGVVRAAKGHLGAFEIMVDDYAQPSPSSRGTLRFGASRDGAVSRCDLILDLSGSEPLFAAPHLREGYLRADPRDNAGMLRAVLKARDLVGSFDKPRYITFTADICAHARSNIVGCHRCLDLCPTGAIAPAGNHVAIDAHICAGCGQCAATCPTGAAGYALPPADALLRKLRTLLLSYREAGGRNPIVLIHDIQHGLALINALARFGDGLPANVLPLVVNEVTQVGIEAIAAGFAYGACAMRFLVREKPRHDGAGLAKTLALAEPILLGLGFGTERAATIAADDPDVLGAALRQIESAQIVQQPASFVPAGGKREAMRLALRELHRVAPAPVDVVALSEGAPFGAIEINAEGCTLCLSCVSACPTGALGDNPERPMLRFTEDACVQCGLCKATCPEKVITLVPRLDFRVATATARVLKEEKPFECIRCGKPFGVRSTIERVTAKLSGKHWMFENSTPRLALLRMCEDCRAIAITEQEFDPHAAPVRPQPRTSEDYLRERQAASKGKLES